MRNLYNPFGVGLTSGAKSEKIGVKKKAQNQRYRLKVSAESK
jgi:hypothetical protein